MRLIHGFIGAFLFCAGTVCLAQVGQIPAWPPIEIVSSGGSAVTVVDTGVQGQSGAPGTSYNYANLTVSTLTNGLLVSVLALDNKSATGLGAVWDSGGTNQTMTLAVSEAAPSGATNGLIALFYRLNPTPGNNTLHFSWTGSANVLGCGVTMSNVNQTSPIGNTASANAGGSSGSISSVIVPSQSNDIVVGAAAAGDTSTVMTGLNNTAICRGNNNIASGANYANGASSVMMTGGFSQNTFWTAVGVDVAHM